MLLQVTGNVLIISLLSACSTKNNPGANYSLKDTVLKEHIQLIEHSRFYDTTDYNYRLLRSYYYNDTLYLKRVQQDIKRIKEDQQPAIIESCRRHPTIDTLQVDEAYQFSYSKTFCDFDFDYTITRKGDSIHLQAVLYQFLPNPLSCQVSKEVNKSLSGKDWDKFEQLIEYIDYWGLKSMEVRNILDGDAITTEAIERNRFDHTVEKHTYISRNGVYGTALYTVYAYLAKLADFPESCSHSPRKKAG